MYTFIYWIISNKPTESTETIDKSQIRVQNTPLHRQVLSLGQDLVYMSSSGKCRTPKHLGLGISLHQVTQSEAVVKLINRFGNCIGYDEVSRMDTCWSEEQINANSSLPVNMVPGKITRVAADNFNWATESLAGIHHDVVNMALYQLCSDGDVIGGFGNTVRASKERRRALENDIRNKEMLRCPNIGGKQPHPQHLLRKIKLEWFLHCSKEHQNMRATDHAFILLRYDSC